MAEFLPPSLPPSLPRGIRRVDRVGLATYARSVRAGLDLTPTEALVAIGIWIGISEKQIADWLERSVPTVHTHLQAIYHKLVRQGMSRGKVALAVAVERLLAPLPASEGFGKSAEGSADTPVSHPTRESPHRN